MSEMVVACDAARSLQQKISSADARVGIVGLGYVGLPLIDAFTSAGFQCLGFDVDWAKVQALRGGESYIRHIPSSMVAGWLARGMFEPTMELSRLSEADVILICVPTPLDHSRNPDLTCVEETTRAIAQALRPGQLIVLESTTYPTTTRDVVVPLLQRNPAKLELGRDFFVAYSPEREDPGNKDFTAAGIPKVVGGTDPASRDLAVALYRNAIVDVVPVSSAEVAEACKILENTYRCVNIAMVNELKVLFDRMGIDIWEVVNAAKTKPFGFQAFYPGPGLGGHCIPIDPFYLSWLARRQGLSARFIELAGEVNLSMPRYVIDRLSEFLNESGKPLRGSRICLLGVAYKKDVDDWRESPSFELMSLLVQRGACLSYHDPHIATLPRSDHYDLPELSSAELTAEFLASQDCVLIATDHTAVDYQKVAEHTDLILDTRNAMAGTEQSSGRIRKA